MAFVVEDGTGKSDATSYASVNDFKAYWTDRGLTFSDSDAVIQSWLIRATEYLDQKYATMFKGWPRSETQALLWPRSQQQNCHNFNNYHFGRANLPNGFSEVWDDVTKEYIPVNVIPDSIKKAVYNFAKIVRDKDLESGAGEGTLEVEATNIKSERVHDISITYNGSGAAGIVVYRSAEKFLKGLIRQAVRG